jgi:prepilin-type N-terminal cleavage/methylation domain-containing protein
MSRGFTLVEVLLVIMIIGLLSSASWAYFAAFRENVVLNESVSSILAALDTARSKTLAGEKASAWGVHFDNQQVIIFQGLVYSSGAPGNDPIVLDNKIEVTEVLVGGGNDIVFKRLTGETDNFGTITVSLMNNPDKVKQIRIEGSGASGVELP